jgi:hypothetical protein
VSEDVFAAWHLEVLPLERFRALGALEQLRHLLRFSLLAPSTHNTVPQAYGVDAERGRIDLYLDRRKVLPASDAAGRQALISVGCALESLTLSAEQYGLSSRFAPDAELATSSRADARFVRVGCVELRADGREPSEQVRRSVLRALVERKVVRAEFDPSAAVPEDLRSSLFGAVADFRGLTLSLATRPADRFAWGKLGELALKHELELSEFRRELGHWILENGDATAARGMRGLDHEQSRSFARELRGELPLASEKLALLSRAERNALVSSSAVCALAASSDDPRSLVEIGRAYQRCAISAWQRGFAHAVHSAIVEVPHVRAICRATLLSGRTSPGLVFRLGKPMRASDWERPHSSRPSLDELIVPAEAAG